MARSHEKGWPPTGFGAALRRERERADMSREQLAVAVDCAFQTIVKIENGYQEPGWPMVLALAEALKVSTEAFRRVTPEDLVRRPRGRPRQDQPQPEPEQPPGKRGRPRKRESDK